MRWLFNFIVLTVLVGITPIYSEESLQNVPISTVMEPVQVELINEKESIQPGNPFWVAIRLNLQKDWHTYWKNPGDSGFPLDIEWTLPDGIKAEPIQWPYPQRFVIGQAVNFGYEDEVVLLVKLVPSADLPKETPLKIGAKVLWLVCSDSTCLPGESEVTVTLPVTGQNPTANAKWLSEYTEKLPRKQWDLKAEKVEDKINIYLEAPHGHETELTDAYFSSEQDILIAHKNIGKFSKLSSNPDRYLLTLDAKPHPDHTESKDYPLKGVLVAYNGIKLSKSLLAFDVDLLYAHQSQIAHHSHNNSSVAEPGSSRSDPIAAPVEWEGGLGLALLFAFIGGMILNLMPCVLPVISLKILSFVKLSGQSRSLTLKHGLYFSLGVLISFWALAGLLLILQAYGRAVGWGFQLQEPLFVGGLAAVLIVFGLSLFGVFEIGTLFASWAGQTESNSKKEDSGLWSSFFSGVLATAVATPCTGPFLGTALGFAVTLPPLLSLSIFTSLGIGMALPYLILAAFPSLTKMLPRPGPWMVTFKEIMGFLMLGTVLWLLWVFGAQTSPQALFLLLTGFLGFAIACWIYGKWGTPMRKKNTRLLSTMLAILFLAFGTYSVVVAAKSPSEATANSEKGDWIPFSKDKIAELQAQGTPVLVDFTAKWCLICQTNHLVFHLPEVDKKIKEIGVVKMLADWTRNDPDITEALRKFGRNGVPLYVLYSGNANEPPQILPQVLTSENVLHSLNQIE